MNQEEIFDNELNENEVKTEKSKKILIIIVILILFGGMYYYYKNSSNLEETKSVQQKIATDVKQVEQKPSNKDLESGKNLDKKEVIASKSDITEKEDLKAKESDKTTNKIDPNKLIKPTDKSSVVKLALIAAGKTDPFSDTAGKFGHSGINKMYTKFGSLPPPPMSIDGLPTIGELPQLGLPNGQGMPEPQDFIAVKGFWGDKVIVSINGITESLRENQSFQGIKVIKIDPAGLVAKFKKNGQIITRNIRNLTEYENKSDLKLVKDLNK